MDLDKSFSQPSYPIISTPHLESLEQQDLIVLTKLYNLKSCLKSRLIELRDCGRKIESIVNRCQDINFRIKKYQSILHPISNNPFQTQICGHNSIISNLDTYVILNTTDPSYYTCNDICTTPRKCMKHDKWETTKLLQVETEYGLASRQLQKCKDDISIHLENVENRKQYVQLCVDESGDVEIPTHFDGYNEVSV